MTARRQHPPAILWCPNCGDALSVPVKPGQVLVQDTVVQVHFDIQRVAHTCGRTEAGGRAED